MEQSATSKGRCDTCGFLSLRFFGDSNLHEATQEYREEGVDTDGAGALSRPPLCLMQAARLDVEVSAATATWTGGMGHTGQLVVAVIRKPDRKCSQWRKWSPGFSPKEHREMLDRERMLQWQAEREEADRKHRRTELRWVIGGVVAVVTAAILGATATVAGAFIERSGQPTIIINPPPIQVVVPTIQPSIPTPTAIPSPSPASQ